MEFMVVCDQCQRVHDLRYRRHPHGWIVLLVDHPKDVVHELGMILGDAKRYDGYWAIPRSRQRKIDADPLDESDAAFTGNPTVKGLKSRRLAAEYLLRAEGFWPW